MPGAAYMSAAKVSAQLQAGTITQAQIDAYNSGVNHGNQHGGGLSGMYPR